MVHIVRARPQRSRGRVRVHFLLRLCCLLVDGHLPAAVLEAKTAEGIDVQARRRDLTGLHCQRGSRYLCGRALIKVVVIWWVGLVYCVAADQAGDVSAAVVGKLPGSLTLPIAREMALRNSPGIEVARERLEAALAAVGKSRAQLMPSLTVAFEAFRQEKGGSARFGIDDDAASSPFSSESYNLYSLTGSLKWLLFDGFRKEADLKGAKYGSELVRQSYQEARRLLLQAVSSAYYEALLAKEAMRIAREDALFNRTLSEENQKRFEVGSVSRSEVLNFRIRAATAESSAVQARNRVDIARIVLAELLGLPDGSLPESVALSSEGADFLPGNKVPVVDDYVGLALAGRPDLLALEQAVGQAEQRVRAAKGGYWPSVSVQGSYGEVRRDNARFNDDRDADASIAGVVSWDLFKGGDTRYTVAQQEASLREARQALRQARIGVVSEVAREIENWETAQELVVLRTSIYKMTLETRDMVRKEYESGRASLTRLNEAQTDLVRAEGSLVGARIRLWRSQDNLSVVTGQIVTGK